MSAMETEMSSSSQAAAELLDCSRYGELEDVQTILQSGVDANYQDANGNTALHLSCANGHADVVRALIKAGAKHLPNAAGNRPLQWAVQNKHEACVKLLMDLYPESSQMNVLDKNGFGKSALTDAFRTGDAEMVKMVLNHKSAEEDILLQQSSLSKGKKTAKEKDETCVSSKPVTQRAGCGEQGEADEVGDEEQDGPSITHELGFGVRKGVAAVASGGGRSNGANILDEGSSGGGDDEDDDDENEEKRRKKTGVCFSLRELPIRNPDECFGDDAREDTTGLNLWAAAVVLARWIASPEIVSRLEGKSVLELGAGCGAGGISAAVHGRPASMVMSDLNAETMTNLAHNIELNRHLYPAGSEVRAVTLDWGDQSTWEEASPPVDVILAADVVYQANETSPLFHAILSLLKPGGSFFHVAPVGERDGLEGFLAHLCDNAGGDELGGGAEGAGNEAGSGFELVSAIEAPPEYTQNPLITGSEDEYMVHFNELPSKTFRLHEFRKL